MATVTARPTAVVVMPDAGTIDWVNASNSLTENGVFAVASAVTPDHEEDAIVTHALKFTGFNTDLSVIPDGSTINSWKYRLKRKSSEASGVHYSLIYRVESGSLVHPFIVPPVWGTDLEWEEQTTTTSMPTAAVIKAADLGLALVVEFYGGDGVTSTDASIDAVEIVIDYTAPANSGPFCVVASQSHCPGSVAPQSHCPGSTAAQNHSPGSVSTQTC